MKGKYEVRVKPRFKEIADWAALGCSQETIARKLSVACSTFRGYIRKYPELSELLEKYARERDENVEITLYLDNELSYARKVLRGEIEDFTILPWLYTQDGEQEVWQDPTSWSKSNPSLEIIKKRVYLEQQLNKAKFSKSDRMYVLTKDFNIKQNNSSAWLTESEYINDNTFNINDFRGLYCLGGVDLAETTDLCAAKALLMRPGDNVKYIYQKYFIPESKAASSGDEINYREMAKLGYVDVTPGNEVDLERVAEWFHQLREEYDIKPFKIGYDNRFARSWLAKMDSYGWYKGFTENDVCERVDQSKWAMSAPMKLVEADLKAKLINNNNNPIDRWCYKNCGIKVDNLGYCMPVKTGLLARNRIDGAVADIIAYAIWMRYRTEFLRLIGEGG